ncbi:unnamed protein product [Owenia fusiformis]|uniref:Uncharacterized protein n=1 Tax=Owenia fusiformis TaxID=6347 RepID=A0A8J1T4L2_OWEFU|nr:unnamed protein product [Owenia fusiformis]
MSGSTINTVSVFLGGAVVGLTLSGATLWYLHRDKRGTKSESTYKSEENAAQDSRQMERELSQLYQSSLMSTPGGRARLATSSGGRARHGSSMFLVNDTVLSDSNRDQPSPEQQSMLDLLYNIAADQANRDGCVHRGITCSLCGQSPLCGVRYKCGSCTDYDVCECCEVKDLHNRTHTFIKIYIPVPPLANSRMPLYKPMYPGKERNTDILSWEQICAFKNETYFDQCEIEAIHEEYKSLCTTKEGITREVFNLCLGPLALDSNLVIDRLFKFYDRDGDRVISLHEMMMGLSIMAKGSLVEKIPYAFQGYDLENKNSLSKENVSKMFKAYFHVTIELVRDVVKACEEEMMSNFDDNDGKPVSALFSAPIPSGSISAGNNKAPLPINPGGSESMYPVMEAMSQDAVAEMVDNIFKMANLKDCQRMSYEKFHEVALTDSSLMAWFDALGTVF